MRSQRSEDLFDVQASFERSLSLARAAHGEPESETAHGDPWSGRSRAGLLGAATGVIAVSAVVVVLARRRSRGSPEGGPGLEAA